MRDTRFLDRQRRDRIHALIRQSKLYRPERWNSDYTARTIGRAIQLCKDVYSGKAKEGASNHNGLYNGPQKLSLSDIPLSDAYNSKRLVQKYGNIIRYCGFWKKFFVYKNGIWHEDHEGAIVELAKSVAKDMYDEAKTFMDKVSGSDDEVALKRAESYLKHAVAAHSSNKIHSMVDLCESEPTISASHDAFDTHPYLLPCINGVVDLKTGKLLPHSPGYLFTKCLPIEFDPSAICPTWKRTLYTAMGGPIALDSPDDSASVLEARHEPHERATRLVRFLKEALGQALSGDVSEHMLVIMWGHGRNGKGVLLETLLELLGAYATKLTQGVLMQNRLSRILLSLPTCLAHASRSPARQTKTDVLTWVW